MLGLKLLLTLLIVVNQSKALRDTTTEFGLEAEDGYTVLVGLVESSELLSNLNPRDVGSGRVEDGEDKLFTVKEPVGDEFGGTDGDGSGWVLEVLVLDFDCLFGRIRLVFSNMVDLLCAIERVRRIEQLTMFLRHPPCVLPIPCSCSNHDAPHLSTRSSPIHNTPPSSVHLPSIQRRSLSFHALTSWCQVSSRTHHFGQKFLKKKGQSKSSI